MKKLVCALIAVSAMLTFASCSSNSSSTPVSSAPASSVAVSSADASSAPESSTAPESVVASEGGNVGDFTVSIDGADFKNGVDGKKCAVVSYTFTNGSSDTTSWMVAIQAKAFQNSVECTGIDVVDGVDATPQMADVKSGGTIKIQEVYVLQDSSTVTIEVSPLFDFSGNAPTITKDFPVQ